MIDEATLTFSRRRVRLVGLLIVVGLVLWLARSIIGPFVVAAMLAYAFTPVVSGVQERTRWPRALIIGLGYLIFFVLLGLLAYIAAEKAGAEWTQLSSDHQNVVYSALHRLVNADTVVIAGTVYSVKDLADQIQTAILGIVSSPSDAVQTAERAVDIGLQVILCLIVTFYFLLDGRRFGQFCLRFLEREQRADALRIAHRIHVVLGRWLRGQLFLIALVASVLYVILGPILHVPFSLALACLSGVLEIIPLVGPIIAAAIAGTVAFGAKGSDTTIVVLVVYFVVRQVEDQVIMPLVIGRAVHLHPVITIFAVLLGLSVWGILGGLLAVPVAAALNVTLRELFPEETGDRGLEAELATEGSGRRLRLPRLLPGPAGAGAGASTGRQSRRVTARTRPADALMARREESAIETAADAPATTATTATESAAGAGATAVPSANRAERSGAGAAPAPEPATGSATPAGASRRRPPAGRKRESPGG